MITSRERLLRCIRHQPIDRVPISTYDSIGSLDENIWEYKQESYSNLLKVIRERTDIMYTLLPEFIYKPNPMVEIQSWDEGNSHYTRYVYHIKDRNFTELRRVDDGMNTTWTLKHLLEDISDIDMYLSIPYDPPEINMERFFKEKEKLGEKGIMVTYLTDPICLAANLFDMGTFLMHAVTETEKVKYFLDAIHERQMYELRMILKHNVKDVIISICGPEYATPPYLSPDYFYDYVTCYLITMCREIKEAGAIPMIHCHGKIGKILDQFAMTEAELLDPMEPPPDGDIELAEIKRLYGKKFCLVGNIELRELEYSDKDRIDYLVRNAMEDAMEGSGFILMPTACPINAPLSKKTEENYFQMIESGLKYGVY